MNIVYGVDYAGIYLLLLGKVYRVLLALRVATEVGLYHYLIELG